MVAGASIRRTETVAELNNGLYTPCALCKADGKTPKKPTWSIQAKRIVRDGDNHVIYYKNAIIRVFGVPVFYSPIFWHPDPTAKRESGLLAPRRIDYSRRRGLSYEQPYYWAISPSADPDRLAADQHCGAPALEPALPRAVLFRRHRYPRRLHLRSGVRQPHQVRRRHQPQLHPGQGRLPAFPQMDRGIRRRAGHRPDPVPALQRRATLPGPGALSHRHGPADLPALRQPARTASPISPSPRSASNPCAPRCWTMGWRRRESSRSTPASPSPPPPRWRGRFDPSQPFLGGRLRFTGSAVTLTRNNPVIDVTDQSGVLAAGPQPYSYHGDVTYRNALGGATPPLSTPRRPHLLPRLSRQPQRQRGGQLAVQPDPQQRHPHPAVRRRPLRLFLHRQGRGPDRPLHHPHRGEDRRHPRAGHRGGGSQLAVHPAPRQGVPGGGAPGATGLRQSGQVRSQCPQRGQRLVRVRRDQPVRPEPLFRLRPGRRGRAGPISAFAPPWTCPASAAPVS